MVAELLAGIELGGTKAIAVLGHGIDLVDRIQIPTTTPDATLCTLAERLAKWRSEHGVRALGVASFGPIRVDPVASDYGRMLATPKAGWSGTDVLGTLAPGFDRAAIQTDVVAAALAEGQHGAACGLDDFAYVTVGTGVGMGLIAGGVPVVGAMHPEAGHWRVRRHCDDDFSGACPFHGDCLEGLVAGPSLAHRFGVPGDRVRGDDPRWRYVADALAEAMATLFLGLATQRVVIGGGVISARPDLLATVREMTVGKLAGYLPFVGADNIETRIVSPVLEDAGAIGALLIAARA
ncbi:ROK family protein [Sphingomonas sp.]|uniref:ROK family protein n=1 Tax=Sphingomonas sp. TaxID=28214 RepID=UPI002C9DA532|nr:ROK family protein [Sphingomonas sp.]HTG38261.1 ROK family protein [Sphingomonas sp.]